MKLEFGKYTDITNFAKSIDSNNFNHFEKIYICPDTKNWWLSFIEKDVNENYEDEPGVFLIERSNIDYKINGSLQSSVFHNSEVYVKKVLLDWNGDIWDNFQVSSLEDAIKTIDGGWGIISED